MISQGARIDYNEDYRWHWLALFVLVGLAFLWGSRIANVGTRFTPLPAVVEGQGVDWFLIARMPESSARSSDASDSRRKLSGWMTALLNEGFHPMLLSDIHARIA